MRRGRIRPFLRKKRTENERVKAHVCVDVCVVNEETAVLGAGGQSYAAWRRWEAHYCQANLKIINCEVDAF